MTAAAAPAPAGALYSRPLLALAVELADYPWRAGAPLQGEARARVCGSRVQLSADLSDGRLGAIGLRVAACAVGQAAAAIFAAAAGEAAAAAIARHEAAIAAWLAGTGPLPDWPRLALLEPALAHPGRHPAILLPWRAAGDALSKAHPDR